MDHDAENREQKAFRRLTAALRKLGNASQVDAVSNAYHPDPNIRNMRRTEALADWAESMVSDESAADSKVAKGKTEKASE